MYFNLILSSTNRINLLIMELINMRVTTLVVYGIFSSVSIKKFRVQL